ncbi:MAG: hypothetical protein U9R02_13510 [Thermodesulfobacteriota bacterium]|nr:hypothetical protein [Thermodesulfobacteriota bacterium]
MSKQTALTHIFLYIYNYLLLKNNDKLIINLRNTFVALFSLPPPPASQARALRAGRPSTVRWERVDFNDINLLVPSPLGERVRVRGISCVRAAKQNGLLIFSLYEFIDNIGKARGF